MNVREFIRDLLQRSDSNQRFFCKADRDGINLIADPKLLDKAAAGKASPLLTHQLVHLNILAEEGTAEPVGNGYLIESSLAVQLDKDTRLLFGLPDTFPGSYALRVDGLAHQQSFSVRLTPKLPSGEEVHHYRLNGPLLQLSADEEYLLTAAEYAALGSVRAHTERHSSDKDEVTNLRLVAQLQRCKQDGLRIDLAHFETLNMVDIQSVRVSAEEQQDGSLLLMPDYGECADFDAIQKRLWQLGEGDSIGSLRVGHNRLVLDERCVNATREILSNKRIAAEQKAAFIKAPSAFLNGALVDLDEGYSLRVKGVTKFQPKFFGDTDESGIDWFDQPANTVSPPSILKWLIKDEYELEQFRKLYREAESNGSEQVDFKEKRIDVSDPRHTNKVLNEIEEAFKDWSAKKKRQRETDATTQLVLDIYDNDEEIEFRGAKTIREVSFDGAINWQAYKFTPYPYQEEGIKWILGLSRITYKSGIDDRSKYGALLADDMGLGKTFMALAAITEYLNHCTQRGDEAGPVLVVAPLSLLENWEDEVDRVFREDECPFDDIVRLQADADLPKFKTGGKETRQAANMELASIRYSLKVGKEHPKDRLDMPRRLVLTTYETLRDYQFSLCRIDWSFAVFDEAQQIKNPNALAALAARGLKARFKLVVTGTPVENSLRDFWSLMDTAAPAYLRTWQEFRQTYIRPINDAPENERTQVRNETGQALRKKVGPLMLRRMKEDQLDGLPEKRIFSGNRDAGNGAEFMSTLRCQMPAAQQQAYEMVVDLARQEQAETEDSRIAVLSGLHRLRDVSLHPDLSDGGIIKVPTSKQEVENSIAKSGKLSQLFKLLQEIRARNEKVIIFCINKRLQTFLSPACQQVFGIKVSIINGETKAVAKQKNAATRRSILREFEAGDGFGIIIMSPIAAGTGLTVVGANNVIHLERHWNPAKEAQATDRVYRIGQEKDVNVYLPILVHPANGVLSFDENLDRLLQQKTALKDAVVTPEDVSPEVMGEGVFGDGINGQQTDAPLEFSDIDQLGWEKFEAFAAVLMGCKTGGEVQLTAAGADKGADAVVIGKQNILIQCKFTETGFWQGGASPVREIYSAQPAYETALRKSFDRLLVITNADTVDKQASQAAKDSNVEIINRRGLRKMLRKVTVTHRDIARQLSKERIEI